MQTPHSSFWHVSQERTKTVFDTEGDYFISKEEKAILAQVSRCYKNVVLVINTGGLMDLAFVEEFDNIRSILQYVQAGQEGGNAFADVVSGDVTPSGKIDRYLGKRLL